MFMFMLKFLFMLSSVWIYFNISYHYLRIKVLIQPRVWGLTNCLFVWFLLMKLTILRVTKSRNILAPGAQLNEWFKKSKFGRTSVEYALSKKFRALLYRVFIFVKCSLLIVGFFLFVNNHNWSEHFLSMPSKYEYLNNYQIFFYYTIQRSD